MSRLPASTCGWEMGDPNEIGIIINAYGPGFGTFTVPSASPAPRNGNYCALFSTEISSFEQIYLHLGPYTPSAEWFYRFGAYFSAPGSITYFRVLDSTGAIQVYFTYNPGNGLITASLGNGTPLGTSTSVVPDNSWQLLEHHVKIDPAAGVIEIKFNGNKIMSLTGINTQNTAATNQGSFDIGFVQGVSPNNLSYVAIDDLGVNNTAGTLNNTWVGDGAVLLLEPVAPGASTELSPYPTTPNWQQVAKVPPNGAGSYVFSSTPGAYDLYAIASLPGGTVQVNCCEELINAANSVSGSGGIAPTIKTQASDGGTIYTAPTTSLGTSFLYYRSFLEVDPATGLAWTPANVNALQIGVTVE